MVSLRFSLAGLASLQLCAFVCASCGRLLASDTTSLLSAWLGSQNDVRSWFAEVIQTRTLKSLAQPLTATGRVWFAAPNRFRWELGNPPQTIALRQAEQMLVVYPRLKHVERYS